MKPTTQFHEKPKNKDKERVFKYPAYNDEQKVCIAE